jgi:hypothetical protein
VNTATSPNDIHDIELLRKRLIAAEKLLVGKLRIIDKLEQSIAQLAQRCWGCSSEKNPGQSELSLFNEAELLAMQAALDDEIDKSEKDSNESPVAADNDQGKGTASPDSAEPKKTRKRRVLPDHLENAYESRISSMKSILRRPAVVHGSVSVRKLPNKSG